MSLTRCSLSSSLAKKRDQCAVRFDPVICHGNVGLHCAGHVKTKPQNPVVAKYSANDAPDDHDIQRFRNVGGMGNRSTIQFSFLANGRLDVWLCVLSPRKREGSAGK